MKKGIASVRQSQLAALKIIYPDIDHKRLQTILRSDLFTQVSIDFFPVLLGSFASFHCFSLKFSPEL